jgi:tetratricopeptide (TPR) repeat protein
MLVAGSLMRAMGASVRRRSCAPPWERCRWVRAGVRGLVLGLMCIVSTAPAAWAHEDLDEQIAALNLRLLADPLNATLYFERAELYRARGERADATVDYDRALRLNPALTAVHLGRARLALDAGEPAAALVAVDRFLAARPAHADAHRVRARALVQLGRPHEAIADFSAAIAAPSPLLPEDYLERAHAAAAAGPNGIADALRGLDEGLDRLGPVVALQLYAMDLEVQQGQYDHALARLQTITARSVRQETWLVRRAQILERAGRTADARAAYREALARLAALPGPARTAGAMADLRVQACAGLAHVDPAGRTKSADMDGCAQGVGHARE